MSKPEPLSLLQNLIERAKALGADAADALYVEADSLAHVQRLGKIEKLERAEARDLGLRVFVGKRQASVSSTELTPAAISALAERAVAMARAVPEDEFCGLADPSEIAARVPAIDMFDASEPAAEVLIARAQAAEAAARAVPGVTNSEGGEASWAASRIWLAASNGFSGHYARSSHTVAVSVLAGEGTGMERDYDWHTAIYGADLEDPAAIGKRAGERAVRRLKPRKMPTKKVPVVFDPRVSGGMVGHLLAAINGTAIARGTSFLKESMGQAVFASGIRIVDDPLRQRGLRSKPFDAEGLATRQQDLVADGRLRTWLLDQRSARQLGLKSTGHAARGSGGPPSPAATNVYLEAGTETPAALMAGIESGLYVTDMIGFGVNMITGDYSRGANGFWIEKGELAYPVSEITIAGNLKDMFRALVPANDLQFRQGVDAPTLRIDGMTVAGA
ncbi:MAG: TldD/PmbA family protein [Rhodospirillaceae bacterium]|nr:TldD/PmbA family protein [Rhodospirillaceae bacterium]